MWWSYIFVTTWKMSLGHWWETELKGIVRQVEKVTLTELSRDAGELAGHAADRDVLPWQGVVGGIELRNVLGHWVVQTQVAGLGLIEDGKCSERLRD
jgi:hypothetical protein